MSSVLRVSDQGGVLVLELDRPQRRNALSRELLSQLRASLTGERALAAKAVIITGYGGTFSAGADLAELDGTEADAGYDDEVSAVTTAIRQLPRPVVAAVEGPCLGAGCDLALACDVRVAGAGAVLGVPAVRLGLLYNPSSVARMRQVLGGQALRRLLLLGERFDAASAERLGLVDEVVGTGQALQWAVDVLGGLPAAAADALAATKGLLNALDDPGADLRQWQVTRLELLVSPGRHQLLSAAQQRHAPRPEELRGRTG